MPPVETPTAPAVSQQTKSPAPKSSEMPIQPVEKKVDLGDDIDAELDALDDNKKIRPPYSQDKPKKPEKVEPPKEKTPEKPKDPQEPDEDENDLDSLDEDNKEGNIERPKDKVENQEAEPVKPTKAADLRTAYEGLKKKVKEDYEPKIAKLESRLKELESSGPETTAQITQELSEKKKRLEELESEIRYVNFQKSQEYKDKYEKPYLEAWQKAIADLSELSVQLEDGTTRTATAQDLVHLANLPLGEARRLANNMFGDAANDVMIHRRAVKDLYSAQEKALKDAREHSSEHEKKLAAQRQIEHQETQKLWAQANESLAKKYPKWFTETEGDDEGNATLRKGFALADLHFTSPKDLTPDQIASLPPRFRDAIKANGDLSIKDRIALDALLRHKIASHSRIALNLKKANARIKELEKSLADYENSEPPTNRSGGKPSKPSLNPMEEAEAEIEKLDIG